MLTSIGMKRTGQPVTTTSGPALKRRKLDTVSATKRTHTKFKTRVIGALDIKSSAKDYCIEIKEDGLHLQYFPNFYSPQQAKAMRDSLESTVTYNSAEASSVIIFGKKHEIARKQTAFGDEGTSYKFSGNDVAANAWSKVPSIERIKHDIEHFLDAKHKQREEPKSKENKEEETPVVGNRFNFCLVNRYKDGNDKIGFHKDDERDLLHKSSIAGVSFGATRDILFKHQDLVNKKSKSKEHDDASQVKSVKIALKSGSLIVMRHPTNAYWYHSIPKRANIPQFRISLTFRNMIVRKTPLTKQKQSDSESKQ